MGAENVRWVGENKAVIAQQDRCIVVDGVRTHFLDAGRGAPLVLVHGLGGPLVWQRIIEPLAEQFRVLAIDLPGFGESDYPSAPFSTSKYAEFLARALDELEIERVVLVGISYGGQISAVFASIVPNRVEQLVIISSTGLLPAWRILAWQPMWSVLRSVGKWLVLPSERLSCWFARRSFFDVAQRPIDLCRRFNQQVMQPGKRDAWLNAFRNVLTTDANMGGTLSNLNAPTLIVWGNEDRLVPVRSAEEFHRRIPSAQITIIQSCGHSLPLEKPHELCNAIGSFCRTSSAERSLYRERQRTDH